MDEIAFVAIPNDKMPANPKALQAILIKNGLSGNYSIKEDTLFLNNEDGAYEFLLADEEKEMALSAGIDIAGDFDDEAATIIDLQELFETAFPECEFSSAYDF